MYDALAGYQVTSTEHSLQSVIRAEAGDEVSCSIFIQNIGDQLASENVSKMAACVIRPHGRTEFFYIVNSWNVSM